MTARLKVAERLVRRLFTVPETGRRAARLELIDASGQTMGAAWSEEPVRDLVLRELRPPARPRARGRR